MIDAHVHVWRVGAHGCTWPGAGLPAIHRDFDLADYRAAAGEIEAVLLVQSQEDAADTQWLLGLDDPLIAGLIGWADLAASDAVARIDTLAAHTALRGLRPMVQGREGDWYDRVADAVWERMAVHGLVLEALVRPRHLESLARLAERHPRLTIVIDHAAKPEAVEFGLWRRAIGAIARRPNVFCKLSGLLTEAVDLDAAFAVLWRCFGPRALLWGSDWPVVNLAASLEEWRKIAERLVPERHHPAVFAENARRLYRLAAGRPGGGKGS